MAERIKVLFKDGDVESIVLNKPILEIKIQAAEKIKEEKAEIKPGDYYTYIMPEGQLYGIMKKINRIQTEAILLISISSTVKGNPTHTIKNAHVLKYGKDIMRHARKEEKEFIDNYIKTLSTHQIRLINEDLSMFGLIWEGTIKQINNEANNNI